MASSATHTVEVDVIAKGLKGILKELEGMGAAVESTSKRQKEANKSSQDLYDTQAKGIIGTANSTKSFSKLSQTIGSGSFGLVGAYATLAANAFAVSAAFNTLREAAKVEQVLKGIETQGARTGRTLTVAASQVQQLTNYSLSYADSLRSVAQVTAAGFGTKDLLELTKVATNASIALGRNIPDSMDRIVKGVSKLEPELLDELGIMTKIGESSAAYARANGKTAESLTSFEKRQALLNAVVAEGAVKFGDLSNSVKPNVYDQVASTFDNLVNSISKLINKVAIPFAAFFATSQLGLLGLGAIFLSTVRDQILPGFSRMAEASRKAADIQAAAAASELKSIGSLSGGKRKAYNEYVTSLKNQTATTEQFTAAVAENAAKRQAINDRDTSGTNFTEKTKARQLAKTKLELEAITAAQQTLSKSSLEGAKANGVAAVSELSLFNVREKSKDIFKSIGEFHNAEIATQEKAVTKMDKLTNTTKAYGKTAVLSMQLAGQATLQMLPYIGLAIAAVGALYAAWEKYGRSEAEKSKSAALTEFNEILSTTNKKMEELIRVQQVAASGAQVTQQALILQANAVLEITSSYFKLANAIDAAEQAKERKKKPKEDADRSVRDLFKGDVGYETAGLAGAEGMTSAISTLNEKQLATVKAFEELAKTSPKVVNQFYALEGGYSAFEKQLTDTKLYKMVGLLSKVDKETRNIVPSIETLAQTFKSSETIYEDFTKSLTPSTPYDAAIKGLKATTAALKEVENSTKNNVGLVTDYTALLGNIGPEMRTLLSTETKGAVQNMESLTASIQNYKSLGLTATEDDKKKQKVLEDVLSIQKKQVTLIRTELEDRTKTLEDNQQSVILDQSRITLGQARLSLLQRQDSITGEGLKKQMQQENSIKAIQVDALKLQRDVAEIKVKSLEADLEALKLQRTSMDELKGKEKLTRAIAILELKSQQAKLGLFKGEESKALGDRIKELQTGDLSSASEAALAAQETSTKTQIKNAKAGVTALSNSMNAIRIGMSSTAEQNARADLVNIKNKIETQKVVKNIARIENDRASLETKITELTISRAGGLSAELRDIKEQSNIRKESLDETFNEQKKILEGEIKISVAMGKGAADALKLQKDKLQKLTDEYNARVALEGTQARFNILDKIAIKTEEERIELIQKSLDFKQKLVSNNADLLNSELALRSAQRSLKDKQGGATDTEASQTLEQIDAAKTALAIAKEEAAIKKSLIDLEYQLLAAQHAMMMQDLKIRKADIDARLSEDYKANKPLDQGLLEQSNIFAKLIDDNSSTTVASFMKGAEIAKKAVENGFETAGVKLATTLAKGPAISGGFLSNLTDMQNRAEVRARRAEAGTPTSPLGAITEEMDSHINRMKESLSALGPQGELVLAVAQGATNMSKAFQDFGKVLQEKDLGKSIAAGLEVASQAINMIQGILKASSDAKIANIDKEIAAEQKRDGKSAASVAKIAEMEKKKQTLAKKSFDVQKKLQMAQIVVSTAAAIAGALSMPPVPGAPWNIALASMMGALGAAQLAIVAGTSFDGGGSINTPSAPSSLSIGKQNSTIDLAKGPSANAGGEVGFLRGSSGSGSNASNYRTIGSAYGGELVRGYGSRGFVVGEKGPERINMDTPITVTPVNDNNGGAAPINANINIHALDSSDVQRVLVGQKGNIIKMLREAANASGKSFMEDVNVNVYTRPNVGKL